MIRVKRVYDPPARADGARYLVERLWPRGMKKENAELTGWPEFQKRYREELKDEAHHEALAELRKAARKGPVTLVYAAHDEERNSAVVLKQVLAGSRTGHGSPKSGQRTAHGG